jgi:plastocyanin
MKKIIWIAILAAIPLILSACASATPPEPLELTINMSEYAFEPANLEFEVGQEVTLHLTNSGALEHEIMIGREVMMTDGRPSGYMVDMFETAGVEPVVTIEKVAADEEDEHMEGDEHAEDEQMEADEHMEGDEHEEDEHTEEGDHEHSGFMVVVPVSHDTYTMKFTVTEEMAGEWEIGCFLLDGVHYSSGMAGALTVME